MKTLSAIILGTLILTSSFVNGNNKSEEAKSNSTTEATTAALVSSISGKVVDINTGEALVGVTLKIDGTDKVAYTDFEGNFEFSNVAAGSVNISASFISYQKSSVSINPTNTNSLKFTLTAIE